MRQGTKKDLILTELNKGMKPKEIAEKHNLRLGAVYDVRYRSGKTPPKASKAGRPRKASGPSKSFSVKDVADFLRSKTSELHREEEYCKKAITALTNAILIVEKSNSGLISDED